MYKQTKLNNPRLKGVKRDWEALKESYETLRKAPLRMREEINAAIDKYLEESLDTDIEGKSKGEVDPIPHENFHIETREELMELLIAKRWGPLYRKYGAMSRTEEYNVRDVVNWKDFWTEHHKEFEELVDDYLRKRMECLEDLRAVKRQLEKWTKNIYRRY